jgi:hypothetical protein
MKIALAVLVLLIIRQACLLRKAWKAQRVLELENSVLSNVNAWLEHQLAQGDRQDSPPHDT